MAEEMRFEEAMRRLEEIVRLLETGVDDLNNIVSLYEEGTGLVELCSAKLKDVETKVEILTEKLTKKAENGKG